MHSLKKWMGLASSAEQQALADVVCNGSRPYLYQWANEHREPDATTAAEIERFTQKLNRSTDGRLPVVWRVELVTACRSCEFAKKCMAQREEETRA